MLLILLCVPSFLLAQSPVGSYAPMAEDSVERVLHINMDYARFRAPQDLVHLEASVSIIRHELTYIPADDGRFRAIFDVSLIAQQVNDTVAVHSWRNSNYVDSLSQITEGQTLFSTGALQLGEGEYFITVKVKDHASGTIGEKRQKVTIIPFSDDTLELSNIQLAASITSGAAAGQFVKNNYKILPNPMALYGTSLPMLYCYLEIYNLQFDSDDEAGDYSIQYSVETTDGKQMRSWPIKLKNKPGSSAVEVSGINIITLQSGTYYFVAEVEDEANGEKVKSKKKFFIYRKGEKIALQQQVAQTPAGSAGLDADRYKISSEEDLDKEFAYVRYISTDKERDLWKKLNADGKRQFLIEFWAERDPSPNTPANEYKQQYLDLVATANQLFKSTREGWKTDRGRILLTYGAPDDIERNAFSQDTRAFHIWHYFEMQGGVQFIFVDIQGMGDFNLVHSTAYSELQDFDWQRWLVPGGMMFDDPTRY